MGLQSLDEVVEQFRREGDWVMAQAVQLVAVRRGHAVVTGEGRHISPVTD